MARTVGILLACFVIFGSRPADASIVMFGDSLVARGNWKQLLGRDDVVNLGVDGDTIRRATARVPQVVRARPKIVIVMLGINDLLGARAPAACAQDMRRLRDRLRESAPTARLVVASVLPVGPSLNQVAPKIDELNRRLRALCADGSCEFLDVAPAFTAEPNGLGRDDLHLSHEGYTRWARVVRRDLAPSG
jgi:lysophospholipase L1-like esterase